jgi:uncharacterized protein (DUF1778 family)
MPQAIKRDERLDLRMTKEEKNLFEVASDIEGLPLTSFFMTNMKKISKDVINKNLNYIEIPETILSYRDSIKFIELLERDDEPNTALKSAYARYRKLKNK